MGWNNTCAMSWWWKGFSSCHCWGPQRHFSLKSGVGIHKLFPRKPLVVIHMANYSICLSSWEKYSKSFMKGYNNPNSLKGRRNEVKKCSMDNKARGPDGTATLPARSVISERVSRTCGTPPPWASNTTLPLTRWQSVLWGGFVLKTAYSLLQVWNKSREPEGSFILTGSKAFT